MHIPAFQPSNAFGTKSFSPCTSLARIRLSASRLVFAAFRSPITLSTSLSVVSNFSVRSVSDALISAVSLDDCSIRVKARSKEASMEALSASSCGGVGGAINGYT